MAGHICCLDLGTSRLKVALFDSEGNQCAIQSAKVACDTVEHRFDAEVLLEQVFSLLAELFATQSISARSVVGFSVTNQRATVVPVDSAGVATGPAISWQHTHCGPVFDEFVQHFGEEAFVEITGLPPSSLWSLGKILWLERYEPLVFQRTFKIVLLHDFVLRRLGAEDFLCDHSNASLTGMLDARTLSWSGSILKSCGLSRSLLPRLVPSAAPIGVVSLQASRRTGLVAGTALYTGAGDQQSATLGVGVSKTGEASLVLGTAAVISCPIGLFDYFDGSGERSPSSPRFSALVERDFEGVQTDRKRRQPFMCTVFPIAGRYVIEGIQNSFVSALHWAIDVLGFSGLDELTRRARAAPSGADGLLYLPHLAGIGSPDYHSAARGAFLGVDLRHTRNHMARAICEGVTLEAARVVSAVEPHVGLTRLVISGGVAEDPLISQLLADFTGIEVTVCDVRESTLKGLAAMTWAGCGRFADIEEAANLASKRWKATLQPQLEGSLRDMMGERYRKATETVCQLGSWFQRS